MKILVELDGVLRTDDDAPIATGVIMVGSLTVYNKIILMSSLDQKTTEYWLNTNKIVDVDDIIDNTARLEGQALSERQIDHARSLGGIDLFITGNPHLWSYAFDKGIPSVMFGQPSYLRPEFRPDAPKRVRAWDDIEKSIEEQNIKRTTDARLIRTEAFNFE